MAPYKIGRLIEGIAYVRLRRSSGETYLGRIKKTTEGWKYVVSEGMKTRGIPNGNESYSTRNNAAQALWEATHRDI